jgi:CCR4-NOT transcription complex subunit 4
VQPTSQLDANEYASTPTRGLSARPPPGFETRSTAPAILESGNAIAQPTGQPKQSSQPVLADEEFPALGAPKPAKDKHIVPAVPKLPLPKVASQVRTSSGKQPEKMENIVESRATVNQVAEGEGFDVDKGEPGASAVSTPRAPKALRVAPFSKNEPPAVSSPVTSVASRVISAAQRPETPASEAFSDSASVVSASVSASRAGSPPPGRVGSAAVRTTTKSQQRKQRKEALRQETKTIAETQRQEPEEHAPVLGRKKKQKKGKPAKEESVGNAAAKEEQAQVPVETTPIEPLEETAKKPKLEAKDEVVETPAQPQAQAQVSPAAQPKKGSKASGKGKAKETRPPTPEPAAAPPPSPSPPPPSPPVADSTTTPEEEEEEEEGKPPSGPAAIFADIRDGLWTTALEHLHLLKPVSSGLRRGNSSGQGGSGIRRTEYCKDNACKCGEIQPEDIGALRAGSAVRKQFHVDGSRMLITPNGDCVRGLTAEEEEDFLSLQVAVAETAEHPGAFVAPRHQSGTGAFSLIKGRAVPNGRPNIFPATAKPQAQDPVGKLQREDALSYINQYVLPRLNIGMSQNSAGKAGGTSPSRDAAAASLNSLAPYFYGPDAAAGVGIYSSASDVSTPRAMHDFGTPAGGSADENGKGPSGAVSSLPLMTVEEAEASLAAARKETDKLEKGLNAVIRRNKRLLVSGGN